MENSSLKIWLPAVRAGSGTDIFTQRLANALERQGITTQISWFPPQYEFMPFLLRYVSPPTGTDIVFANSWNGFAFKCHGLPLVVTVHHSGFSLTPKLYKSLAQRLYHRILIRPFEIQSLHTADAITAVSTFTAKSLCHVINHDNIEIIHNWVDVNRFRPLLPTPYKNNRPFRLLFVGKLSQLKGADLLAPIMRLLGPNFELRIAGKPKLGRDIDYSPNIRSLGWLDEDELIHAYQECDALLFPSRSEGFGYAALEAMACGKPVIGSDATALPEVVINGVSGILCSTDDIAAFASACRLLATDPALCMRMGKSARERAVEQFSETKMITHYLALISRLAGR